MKKILTCLLALMTVFSLCIPTFAAEDTTTETYTITVNGQTADLSNLPISPYKEGDTVMVPLRKIGEALGYTVNWNPETRVITIEDCYVQKASLTDGSAFVTFESKLKVIDMSREIENAVPTVVRSGCTYVPFEFFREFFNDVSIDGTIITIAPTMNELQTT